MEKNFWWIQQNKSQTIKERWKGKQMITSDIKKKAKIIVETKRMKTPTL